MSLTKTLAFNHLRYKIGNARVKSWPFDHFFVRDVFPDDYFQDIIDSLPPTEDYKTGEKDYNGRKFANPTQLAQNQLFDFLLTEDFLKIVIQAFLPAFKKRFPDGNFKPEMDLRLVLDSKNYSIGPHTDAPWKVVSLLFYLPRDYSLTPYGTSIYVPKNPTFRCSGGPHHLFPDFNRVWTAPFLPNSCLGFFKTDKSFHGVEPITIPCRRDVLLWNLYDRNMRK